MNLKHKRNERVKITILIDDVFTVTNVKFGNISTLKDNFCNVFCGNDYLFSFNCKEKRLKYYWECYDSDSEGHFLEKWYKLVRCS